MPVHEDGITFKKSEGVQREISSEVLTAFATGRRERISELDTQLRNYAKAIRALVPDSLSTFATQSQLTDIETLMKLISTFGSTEANVPYATLFDKIRDPESYGFRNLADAYRGMLKLKEAWRDVLDVRVSRRESAVGVWVQGISKSP